MRYYARKRKIDDYPHNGAEVWGVLDSMGGFVACGDAENAIAGAERRNFAWSQDVKNRLLRAEREISNLVAWAGRQN